MYFFFKSKCRPKKVFMRRTRQRSFFLCSLDIKYFWWADISIIRVTQAHTVTGDVQQITKKEVRISLRRIKNGKAVGPDMTPIEAQKYIEDPDIKVWTEFFNRLQEGERCHVSEEKLFLIFLKKDPQNFSNYRGKS